MIDMKFSILETDYHLVTDERQYILTKIVESKSKQAVDGLTETSPKFFRTLDQVVSYIDRTAPIELSKELSSPEDVKWVLDSVRALTEALRVDMGLAIEGGAAE